jgi:hypothetical protein
VGDADCKVDYSKKQHVNYGQGEAFGYLSRDKIRLTDKLESNGQKFISVEKVDELAQLMADGIIGLGFKDLAENNPNILLHLWQNKQIKNCVFSIFLSNKVDEDGLPLSEIIFGDHDPKFMADPNFHYAPVIDSRQWGIRLNSLWIEDQPY